MSRVVIWYSDGAASTVAGMLTLKQFPDAIPVYTATNSEHSDNVRYRKEVEEKLFKKKVTVLQSDKYHDIWDVFEKTGWLVGPKGARCTTELKKKMRQQFEEPGDVHVFGYTADHKDAERAKAFAHNNFELNVRFPLIERGIRKADCLDIISQAGIELPVMYKLGYLNNNCLGCVKGQAGYWNKIRVDFPKVFERMAKVERKMNVAINKSYARNEYEKAHPEIEASRKKLFLDDLDPEVGNYKAEPTMSCGLFCGGLLEED